MLKYFSLKTDLLSDKLAEIPKPGKRKSEIDQETETEKERKRDKNQA